MEFEFYRSLPSLSFVLRLATKLIKDYVILNNLFMLMEIISINHSSQWHLEGSSCCDPVASELETFIESHYVFVLMINVSCNVFIFYSLNSYSHYQAVGKN